MKVAAYLSPSGYVANGCEVLAKVLEAGETFCAEAGHTTHRAEAFVVLPIGAHWLRARMTAVTWSRRRSEAWVARWR